MLSSHFDKQLVDAELLRLIAEQSRRVPYPIILAMGLIASFAWQYMAIELVISWLFFSGFCLLVRAYVLPKLASYKNVQKANEIAIILSAMNGIAHGSSCLILPLLFSVRTGYSDNDPARNLSRCCGYNVWPNAIYLLLTYCPACYPSALCGPYALILKTYSLAI